MRVLVLLLAVLCLAKPRLSVGFSLKQQQRHHVGSRWTTTTTTTKQKRSTISSSASATSTTTTSSTSLSSSSSAYTTPGYRRAVHWVVKTGYLEETLRFFKDNFGMHVFRHEEFATGCEATCNGPYGGAWSKTMIGLASEQETFALELTYNYGIGSYERGNDLRYLAMKRSSYIGPVENIITDRDNRLFVEAPNLFLCLVDDDDDDDDDDNVKKQQSNTAAAAAATSSNKKSTNDPNNPFLFVSLHVTDLKASSRFYEEVLGAKKIEPRPKGAMQGTNVESIFFGWNGDDAIFGEQQQQVAVELVELPEGVYFDRGGASGRFAMETEDGAPLLMANKFKAFSSSSSRSSSSGSSSSSSGSSSSSSSEKQQQQQQDQQEDIGGKILHGPIKLKPHGEEVVIIADPDGHEYCFVDARGFKVCTDVSKIIATSGKEGGSARGGSTVDWKYREALEKRAQMNSSSIFFGPDIEKAEPHTYSSIVAAAENDVLLELFAPWCVLCEKRKPIYKRLASALKQVESDIKVVAVDGTHRVLLANLDENFALESMTSWTRSQGFPALFFIKKSEKDTPILYDGNWDAVEMLTWMRDKASKSFDVPTALVDKLVIEKAEDAAKRKLEEGGEEEKESINANVDKDDDDDDDDCGKCSL